MNRVSQAVKKALGIRSPSEDFRDYLEEATQEVIAGIKQGFKKGQRIAELRKEAEKRTSDRWWQQGYAEGRYFVETEGGERDGGK